MDILLVRQLLEQLLDYHYELYMGKLRDWFSHRITKHQFDKDLAHILKGEVLTLHNQLLMAILAQSLTSHGPGPMITYPVDGYEPEDFEDLDQLAAEFPEADTPLESESSHEFVITPIGQASPPHYKRFVRRRFPAHFAKEFQVAHQGDYDKKVNVIPNVTHGLAAIEQRVLENPFYEQIFKIRDKSQPVLTSGANLYGRFLVEAWKKRLKTVHPAALHMAIKATIHHIKDVIIAIAKQRKAFRLRDGRYVHSIGAPYPNPYLLQGHQMFEETYGSDTAKLAEVMQIPSFLPTREERERLAALEVAASVPLKYPHLKTKATLADLLDAIQANRATIPNSFRRAKICEIIYQKSKGHGETYSSYEGGKDLVPKTVFPILNY